ncbi:MAG: SUMF1/EgtB/PvdO family nonheme iron enzyme, partial [Chitinivibrionales bacterium]|nr:SUMF1/EgtB/PvdO family nonheme iron enzyme [Chitinivibrionales bacterium]
MVYGTDTGGSRDDRAQQSYAARCGALTREIGMRYALSLGLILFSLHSVKAEEILCICDVWLRDGTFVEGAHGILKNAGVEAVSDHYGRLVFTRNAGGTVTHSPIQTKTIAADPIPYYTLNGRCAGPSIFPKKGAHSLANQVIVQETGRAAVPFLSLTGWGDNVSHNDANEPFQSQSSGNAKARAIQEVVDTLVVTMDGYHVGRQLILNYYWGEIVYLVPLPHPDSIPSGMVHIPEGDFFMGSEQGDPDETPVRMVTLSSFYMDTVEVTQAEYESVMGVTPWNTVDSTARQDKGDRYPAWGVNWYDAVLFCNAKSKLHGRDTVYTWSAVEGTPGDGCVLSEVEIHLDRRGFRLPTEAEWEYACLTGINAKYMWGNTIDPADDYAWYQDNSGWHAHVGGKKESNWFGIYDLIGNLYEWTNDSGLRN